MTTLETLTKTINPQTLTKPEIKGLYDAGETCDRQYSDGRTRSQVVAFGAIAINALAVGAMIVRRLHNPLKAGLSHKP